MRALAGVGCFALLLQGVFAQAFPEMIRLGYVNCTSCHVSPSGGGLLTDYGRSISAEALSHWMSPREELPGHGLFPEPPAWLKIGGDLRVIQTYADTPQATARSFFLMQSDLELGLNFGKLWLVQSLGVQGGPEGAPKQGEFVSHHFYGLYNLTEEVYLRAGKYLLPFGLNIPDHTSLVRRNLGFDQGQESYNVETGSMGERWSSIVSLSFGRKEGSRVDLEKGGALQVGYNVGDTKKLLGSLAYLKKNGESSRVLLGPQILWGFSPQWVFLGEYDYQEKVLEGPQRSVQKGAVTYSRLQYQWTRGVDTYVLHQFSYLDFTQLASRVSSYGAGVLFYPRPHFELSAEVDYAVSGGVNPYSTSSWVLGHYYF